MASASASTRKYWEPPAIEKTRFFKRAVIDGIINEVAFACLVQVGMDGQANQHILLFVAFIFVDTQNAANKKITNADAAHNVLSIFSRVICSGEPLKTAAQTSG